MKTVAEMIARDHGNRSMTADTMATTTPMMTLVLQIPIIVRLNELIGPKWRKATFEIVVGAPMIDLDPPSMVRAVGEGEQTQFKNGPGRTDGDPTGTGFGILRVHEVNMRRRIANHAVVGSRRPILRETGEILVPVQ